MSDTLNRYFADLFSEGESKETKAFLERLFESSRKGHLCLKEKIAPSLREEIIEEGKDLFPKTPIVRFQDSYYLQKNWVFETHLLNEALRLKKSPLSSHYDQTVFENSLASLVTLTEEQKKAVQKLFESNFSILCGGPGTGKTYTAGFFVKLLTEAFLPDRPYRILVAAPTGKAALHLERSLKAQVKESSEIETSTLHRLLNLRPGNIQLFTSKKLDADLVIVDEASMIDVTLFAHLLEMIQSGKRLLLMGDPNQLPPIEAGSVFAEFSKSNAAYLTKCLRSDNDTLNETWKAVLKGDQLEFFKKIDLIETLDEAFFMALYAKVKPRFSSNPLEPECFFASKKEFQALSSMRKGPFGVEALNERILKHFEKECPEKAFWALPIIATSSSPHLGLSNGSLGVLIGQKRGGINLHEASCYFEEMGAAPLKTPPPYELSFVLSVHKSQGSEWDEVFAIFPEGSENFGKEILYTAATRAKKSWKVFGKRESLEHLLSFQEERASSLNERLMKTK